MHRIQNGQQFEMVQCLSIWIWTFFRHQPTANHAHKRILEVQLRLPSALLAKSLRGSAKYLCQLNAHLPAKLQQTSLHLRYQVRRLVRLRLHS